MKCNTCNNIIPDDSKFCKFCGAKIVVDNSTIECPSCHNQIPADSKFCPDCGSKISVLAETKANVVVNNNNEPQEDPLDYLFPYFEGGRVGFKSLIDNKVYIPAKYEDAREFHEGFAAVKTNGKWGYMDKTGKWVLPAKEEWVEDVKGGVAITGAGDRYKAGDCLMNFWSTINWKLFDTGLYTSHSDFKNGVCQVWDDGKSHYSSDNEEGDDEILLPWRKYFDSFNTFDDNKSLAVVRKNKSYGVVKYDTISSDFRFQEILPCMYPGIRAIGEGLLVVYKGLSNPTKLYSFICGIIDISGKEIVPMEYSMIGKITNGLIPVTKKGKTGALDLNGNVSIPLVYDSDFFLLPEKPLEFKSGFAKAKNNGKYGVIDINGNTIIPFIYDDIRDYGETMIHCNMLAACMNGKWGFINIRNEVIIDFIFEWVDDFQAGKAQVKINNKQGMINTRGVFIIPAIYDGLDNTGRSNKFGNVHLAELNEANIVIDDFNNRLPYDLTDIPNENVCLYRLWVREKNKWGMVDEHGNIIHDCIYTNPGGFNDMRPDMDYVVYKGKAYKIDYFGNSRQK